nr:MAG TPA: hypothetical protein [Caudoviricetes sp.]
MAVLISVFVFFGISNSYYFVAISNCLYFA